ncbi:restriction endonuclease subunit S [Nostoc sp. DedSLP04]|uniref:restriction endonuclease subunit S n=1 Tax=Nostoc sp. DedSLP04 TaxID=3075401 RepID=UPI002AD40CB9|nr:restriction endonuclease subunit S [Nostoc sp. DedSLP04]MDZ8035798.1 restriction endonuclease subunit S [Nostoc sp. DedSLP04]
MNYIIKKQHMKDSGVLWIEEIPRHWNIETLSNLVQIILSNVDKKNNENEKKVLLCNYVNVYYNKFIDSRIDFMEASATNSEVEKFSLQINDVLITKDSETPDDIAVPSLVVEKIPNVLCGYHLSILRPFIDKLDGRYLLFSILSTSIKSQFSSLATGITRYGLSYKHIKSINICVPPLQEQKAIASFLDRKTTAIDTLIAKKQRLIQLLEEKRTALINQAVTKGLNSNVPMKNSGIAWISKIPEHWEVSRLSFLSITIQTGPFGSQLHASEYVENGIPLVNPINIQRGNIIADYQKTVNQEVAIRLSRHKLLIGDLVFARRGELGRCGVINKNNNGWLCGTGCIQVRFSKIKVDPDYLNLFISIPWVASWLSLESVGSTMDNLNTEILSTLPIILPPKEEQIKIFQYIELKKYLFDKLITTIDKQINKLQEYRQSLITAAVTGKIDIREEVAT